MPILRSSLHYPKYSLLPSHMTTLLCCLFLMGKVRKQKKKKKHGKKKRKKSSRVLERRFLLVTLGRNAPTWRFEKLGLEEVEGGRAVCRGFGVSSVQDTRCCICRTAIHCFFRRILFPPRHSDAVLSRAFWGVLLKSIN